MSEFDLSDGLGVSRETFDRLKLYEGLVRKWNPAINLVARSTLDHIWQRHFVDSAQLYAASGARTGRWVDLGSGGGFPGLVVAALAAGEGRELKITLVESDQRKAAFLRTAAREMGLAGVEILTARIEDLPPLKADILSARALAPLDGLLGFCTLHMKEDGIGLFPKGQNYRTEIDQALENWRFSYEALPSATADDAVVLTVRNIERA